MLKLWYIALLLSAVFTMPACKHTKVSPEAEWKDMLDSNLSNWDKFIGVPHYSVPLDGYPKGDGMNGTPLGLNKDPLGVYSIQMEEGKPVLHISGQIYGGLTTKQEYGNYHLKAMFKWGEKKYEPRLNQRRDNGILYHAYGPHGAYWNVWMRSHELQVQENDMGDYFSLAGPVAEIQAIYTTQDNETEWMYTPGAPYIMAGTGNIYRCRRSVNKELQHGEWNELELICFGTKAIHIINGQVVNVISNGYTQENGVTQPLTKGYIQIQSEGAEAYYKDIQIKSIYEMPAAYSQY